LGGNDCINGQALNQKVYDGNGRERVYAFAHARVAIGSGNSLVVGGSGGHDTITVANGNTRIFGHGGFNRIEAGLGRVRINGGPGPNRVFTPSTRALVNCGSSGFNTAYLRDKAIPYARAHGCTRIIHLV
jgi:Ca2+-binding RTX toxin-like protein